MALSSQTALRLRGPRSREEGATVGDKPRGSWLQQYGSGGFILCIECMTRCDHMPRIQEPKPDNYKPISGSPPKDKTTCPPGQTKSPPQCQMPSLRATIEIHW